MLSGSRVVGNGQTDRHDERTDGETDRQTDMTNGQMERQTDRHD